MNARIKDKIKDIKEYLGQLESISPKTLEDYEKDFKTKAACERFVEKIMEAITDLAILIIKDRKLNMPEDDAKSFSILAEAKIIDDVLAEKLRKAKGMRNVLAHQYREVNDEIIFDAISSELQRDVKAFLREIRKLE